jgi:Concanavalin A-like lectin/glucanases superfamily
MAIRLNGKGQTIGGVWYGPWDVVTGLDPDKEALFVQGGSAVYLGPQSPMPILFSQDSEMSMSAGAVNVANALQAPVKATRCWIPGDQGVGVATDLSGNSGDLTPAGTMTTGELWAVSDQMSFPGGVGKFATIPGAVANIDLLTTSVICAFRLRKPAPAASEFIFGQAADRSWLFFQVTSSGAATFYMRGGNNEETFTLGIVAGIGNDAWHHILFAFDSGTKTFWLYVDKVLKLSGAVALTKTTANTKSLPIGAVHPFGAGELTAGSTGYALSMQDFLLVAPPSVINVNLQRLARKLYHTRCVPIVVGDLA